MDLATGKCSNSLQLYTEWRVVGFRAPERDLQVQGEVVMMVMVVVIDEQVDGGRGVGTCKLARQEESRERRCQAPSFLLYRRPRLLVTYRLATLD